MNALTNFVFDAEDGNAHAFRSLMIEGDPWFVAADVCSVLGIKNNSDAIKRLDDDEKASFNLGLSGGETNIVNESGLYSLILGSRKPEAKAFKKWVTAQVLPSIRKTGSYTDPAAESLGAHQPRFLSHGADIMVAADRTFRSLIRSGRAAGMRTAGAIIRANAVTFAQTGVNLLETLEVDPLQNEAASEYPGAQAGGANSLSGARVAPAAVREFWRAVSACFMGLPGPVPMLSNQAHSLYLLWASQEKQWAVSLQQFAAVSVAQGYMYTKRVRWTDDAGQEHMGRFLVPTGITRFNPSGAVRHMHKVLREAEAA